MNDNVTQFPNKKKDRKSLSANDVDFIGFITEDDRDFYIDDRADIAKIFKFLRESGIKILLGSD